jgi:hypothetical protein
MVVHLCPMLQSGAKARVPTFLRVVTFDRDLIIFYGRAVRHATQS